MVAPNDPIFNNKYTPKEGLQSVHQTSDKINRNKLIIDQRQINKLFRAYDKAESALIQMRDELFPPGTRVRSQIDRQHITVVTDGSLYPHQVNTLWGHMSWRYLDKVEDENGG